MSKDGMAVPGRRPSLKRPLVKRYALRVWSMLNGAPLPTPTPTPTPTPRPVSTPTLALRSGYEPPVMAATKTPEPLVVAAPEKDAVGYWG